MSKETKALSLTDQAKALDSIASKALAVPDGSFEGAFAVADAIGDLRSALTSDVMRKFMALQNTSLGFRTDKDPAQTNSRTGKPNEPYDEATVKECLIEAVLRGVQPVGNQFNIIAKRTYITKEGFEYKLKKLDGLTNLKVNIGIPKTAASGQGAVVQCSATWTYKNKDDRMEAEIPVKVNEGMGADAIIGKCQRKFLKRIFETLTGTSVPDGDASDTVPLAQIAAPAAAVSPGGLFTMGKPAEKPAAPNTPEPSSPIHLLRKRIAESGFDEAVVLQEFNRLNRSSVASIRELSAEAIFGILDNFDDLIANL